MRIYLPSTVTELRAATLEPRLAHAVTPALRAALPDEDDEGLEYAAQLLAADDSLDLLAEDAAAPRRRLVVAADVPESDVEALSAGEEHAPSLVRLTAPVAWEAVACAHVDEVAAGPEIEAALAEDEAALDRLAERDLLWYDVSELSSLAGPSPR